MLGENGDLLPLPLQEDPTISALLGVAPVYEGHMLQVLKAS